MERQGCVTVAKPVGHTVYFYRVQLLEPCLGRGMLMSDILRVRNNSSFYISVIRQIGLRHCHNSRIIARPSSMFNLLNYVRGPRAGQETKLQVWGGKRGLELRWHELSTTSYGGWGVCAPCCLHTSSSTHSHFIPLKYIGHYAAVVGSIFTQKSPRLERGLDHLYRRPCRQNYSQTFGRWYHILHTFGDVISLPLSTITYITDAFPRCQGALASVNVTWCLFVAFFISPHRRAHRRPELHTSSELFSLKCRGQRLGSRLRNKSRPGTLSGTASKCVLSHDKLLLFFRRANAILSKGF